MNRVLFCVLLSSVVAASARAGDVESYIRTNLPRTVVTTAVDDGPIMALPRPYSMPGLPGVFREMYYWDTYFTNLGFLRIGDLEQAVNNTEDIAYMIDFVSVAAFYPLYVGLATPEQAARTRELLAKLEFEHGLASSENRNLQGLQWDYPHGWAPLHYIAISGLVRYGYAADAKRLAAKYCTTLETAFAKTGELWEKYDMTTGEVSVCKEYKTPTMLGWTAGVYLWCKELLK